MKTQYAHIPDDDTYAIFRNSAFARTIRRRIASLEADDGWSVQLQQVPQNPDAVTIACRDDAGRIVPGTASPGEYVFTRSAHEDYDNDPASSRVQTELDRLEEFLVRVKDAFRSKK